MKARMNRNIWWSEFPWPPDVGVLSRRQKSSYFLGIRGLRAGVGGYGWNRSGTKWGTVGQLVQRRASLLPGRQGADRTAPNIPRRPGQQVVVTRGLDECVAVYAPQEWARNEKKLRGL